MDRVHGRLYIKLDKNEEKLQLRGIKIKKNAK